MCELPTQGCADVVGERLICFSGSIGLRVRRLICTLWGVCRVALQGQRLAGAIFELSLRLTPASSILFFFFFNPRFFFFFFPFLSLSLIFSFFFFAVAIAKLCLCLIPAGGRHFHVRWLPVSATFQNATVPGGELLLASRVVVFMVPAAAQGIPVALLALMARGVVFLGLAGL